MFFELSFHFVISSPNRVSANFFWEDYYNRREDPCIPPEQQCLLFFLSQQNDSSRTASRNWQKQVCFGYVVNLSPSRPPMFSPSESESPDKESHSQSKQHSRRCRCQPLSAVPITEVVEHAPSMLLPRTALIMNSSKTELLRVIGMANITCARQISILRRRPTRVDKTGPNSITKRLVLTALKLGRCLAKVHTL